MTYEHTGLSLKFEVEETTFKMDVKRAVNAGYKRQKLAEFVVFIHQTTKVNDLEGCEDFEDFQCTYKCVCLNSPTEHSALHYAGKKYIKDWNIRHRIGKDFPLFTSCDYTKR